jgi:hypothetical protein
LIPTNSLPERVIVLMVTVLPTNTLASVILVVALIAILSDTLIAELSLSAVAIAGKLALALTAGPAAIRSSVLNPGASVAKLPLEASLTTMAVFVVLVPAFAEAAVMLMVVVCHFESSFLDTRGCDLQVAVSSRPISLGSQGVCHGNLMARVFRWPGGTASQP